MAKEYKDHSPMSAPRAQRLIARLVISILLVTIGVLGYNYWALLTSHKDTTARLTLVKADLDSTLASRADLKKMMESCEEQLKLSSTERKQLKDSEATLTVQLKSLEEKQKILEEEKTSLNEKLAKDVAECRDASKQEVANCDASCKLKIEEVKKTAEEACQQQKVQYIPATTISSIVQQGIQVQQGNQVLNQPNDSKVGDQQVVPANPPS